MESRKNVGFYIGSDTMSCLITRHVKAFFLSVESRKNVGFLIGSDTMSCLITRHVKAFFLSVESRKNVGFLIGSDTMSCLITRHVKAFFLSVESRKNVGFYIGATDETEEGVWRWNNNNNRLSYQGFRKTDQVNEAEDCAILWGSYAFVWGDINCNRANHFICEKSK